MTDATIERRKGPAVPHHIVTGLLDHLRAGTTDQCDGVLELDPAIFVDADIARRERTGVFGGTPIVAAHSSDVPEPNDYITRRLPNNQALIVRQPDRSVRVFLNMCRHRGATLVPQDKGHGRVFSCQYHGWSYDLDGRLRNITYGESFGSVDRSCMGLVELPAEERHGFIWVVDNPDGSIDVADWLGPETDAHLAGYGMEHMICYRTGVFDEPVNWKIMHDAFLDGYHIKYAHPNSAGRIVHTNTYVVEDHGKHCRFASPRKSLDAWLDRNPDPDEPMVEHVMLTHFIGPNNTLLQLSDNYQLLTFFPISDNPAESRMEMRLIVPRREDMGMDEEVWNDRWEKNWHILQTVLAGEDFPILRGIQRSYSSSAATPTVLGQNEVLNQAFHREIARLRG